MDVTSQIITSFFSIHAEATTGRLIHVVCCFFICGSPYKSLPNLSLFQAPSPSARITTHVCVFLFLNYVRYFYVFMFSFYYVIMAILLYLCWRFEYCSRRCLMWNKQDVPWKKYNIDIPGTRRWLNCLIRCCSESSFHLLSTLISKSYLPSSASRLTYQFRQINIIVAMWNEVSNYLHRFS